VSRFSSSISLSVPIGRGRGELLEIVDAAEDVLDVTRASGPAPPHARDVLELTALAAQGAPQRLRTGVMRPQASGRLVEPENFPGSQRGPS